MGMNNVLHGGNALEWARMHFEGIELGDLRRNRRGQRIAEAMAENPGVSIPQLFTQVYEVKAAYTFFDMEEVTPLKLQASHREKVKAALADPGTYLLIEDGSEFVWNDKVWREGLGQMHKNQQGFILHSSLAVKWPGIEGGQIRRGAVEVIGLAHQEYYPRKSRPEGEGDKDSDARKKRSRESELWKRSGESIGDAPNTNEVRLVRVGDRGADIEFFLRDCKTRNHGFVVRAAQNRSLVNEQGELQALKLFEQARSAPALGEFDLPLRSRPGQAERIAHLSVSVSQVRLRSPYQAGHDPNSRPAIEVSVVRVWEANPPPGIEALEWVLLCDQPLFTFEQALECVLQYASRWLIEEYHKGLKTGLGADDLQLETAHRLFAAIALMAVVAVRLLALKEGARIQPLAPAAQSGLSLLEIQVLAQVLQRELSTVEEVALAIGRLGGHMNRKSDGLPGWLTLWRGMKKLQTLVEGVRLANSFKTFGV